MKTFLLTALITMLSLQTTLAGNADAGCAETAYISGIQHLILQEKPFYADEVSGKVTIRFQVDENRILHIVDIESANMYLRNHAFNALEGKEMKTACDNTQVVYEITVDFLYEV